MIVIAALLSAVIGGAWRHALGGWDGPFKWALGTRLESVFWGPDDKGAYSPRRSIILALGSLLSWPLWLALPWWQAAIGTVLCDLFWRFGHDVSSPKIWLRYGPLAACWVIARKLWGDRDWMGIGETAAGAVFYAALSAVALSL